MATAKKSAAKAKPAKAAPTGTDMVKWDEELAKYADESVASEANTGSGLQSFSLKAGVLSFDDNTMPNNEMAVVVLDHILENVYYEEAYDPDSPAPPSAYALGRDEKTMTWHEDSIPELEDGEKIAGELCCESSINQWGSADKGRGKACRNLRRLLLIPAGTFAKNGEFKLITDEEHYEKVAPAFLKIPPTSTTNWSAYVKKLAGALRRPPFAVVTRIKVVPDAKTQFKVTFEALEEMPAELFQTLLDRHNEAAQLIMQPYNMEREEEAPAPRRQAAKKAAKKAPAKKAGGRKY